MWMIFQTLKQPTIQINIHQNKDKYANRQFDWLEISLVYDKSDKHNNI